MMTLFDEEEIQKIYIENERRDAAAAAAATAKAEGIHYLVKTCQDLLVSYPDTVKRVMDGYKLSEEKAKEYVTLYWQ